MADETIAGMVTNRFSSICRVFAENNPTFSNVQTRQKLLELGYLSQLHLFVSTASM